MVTRHEDHADPGGPAPCDGGDGRGAERVVEGNEAERVELRRVQAVGRGRCHRHQTQALAGQAVDDFLEPVTAWARPTAPQHGLGGSFHGQHRGAVDHVDGGHRPGLRVERALGDTLSDRSVHAGRGGGVDEGHVDRVPGAVVRVVAAEGGQPELPLVPVKGNGLATAS